MRIVFAGFDRSTASVIPPLLQLMSGSGNELVLLNNCFDGCGPEDVVGIDIVSPVGTVSAAQPGADALKSVLNSFVNVEEVERVLGYESYVQLMIESGESRWNVVKCFENYMRFVREFLVHNLPDLVVLCPGEIEADVLVSLCQQLSIKYCFLLPPYYEFNWLSSVVLPLSDSSFIVSSEYGKERLLKRGADPSRIFVVGNPRMDKYGRLEAAPATPPDGSPESHTILLTLQSMPTNQEVLYLLERYVKARPNVKLVVRPHPQIPLLRRERWRLWSKPRVSIDTAKDIEQSLSSAMVLVTISSLSLLDAMAFGVPVICYKDFPLPHENPLALAGDVISVNNYDQLQSALDALLFDASYRGSWIEARSKSCLRYLGPLDGQSAQRAVDVIYRLATPLSVEANEC